LRGETLGPLADEHVGSNSLVESVQVVETDDFGASSGDHATVGWLEADSA
jgi:hypothetical protein